MPIDAGPITRIPWFRAMRTSSRWRARPRAPSSAYPLVITRTPRTPARPHSRTTCATRSMGTAMIATSTVSGTSAMLGWAIIPATSRASGFTA